MDAFSAANGRAAERALGPEHADSLVALSAEAGWNQVAADWRFMLAQGTGLGMADAAGTWVASGLALPLGPRLSCLSLLLTPQSCPAPALPHPLPPPPTT